MKTTKEFCNYLSRRFPCGDLEEVAPEVLSGDFVATPDFWKGVDKALKPYVQDESMRCVEILDYLARLINRNYGEVRLCHCKNLEFAALMLEYMRLSLYWHEDWSCRLVLTFLNIEYEVENLDDVPNRQELLRKCAAIHHLLRGYMEFCFGRIFVLNEKIIREYLEGYDYVLKRNPNYLEFFKARGLID